MPYAEPTSPVASTLKQLSPEKQESRPRQPTSLTSHDSNNDTMSFRSVPNPSWSAPRRSSLTTSSPVRTTSSLPSTTAMPLSPPRGQLNISTASVLASMRSVDALPRSVDAVLPSVDALPRHTSVSPSRPIGSLGLHFGQSTPPLRPSRQRSSSDGKVPFPSAGDSGAPSHSKHSPPKPSLGRSRANRERGGSASSLLTHNNPVPLVVSSVERSTNMIRKKSGELVKSSLKQRSQSTPDLGRGAKTGSGDGLRERTKSVRFDDMGLESVVLFLRGQRPTDVSKAAVDAHHPNDTPTETEEDNDTDLSDFVHFRTRRGSTRPDPAKEVQLNAECTVPRLRLDFGPGTQGILKGENVVLERVDMQNGSPLAMRGTVLVRNLAFQKWVAIRFTLDHWQTVSEVACQHVSHIPAGTTGDEGWDRFRFTIRLEDYKRKIEERLLNLCVRFSIDGHEWWDSNLGENYRFNFKRVAVRRTGVPAPLRINGPGLQSASPLPPLRGVPRSADKGARSTDKPPSWLVPRVAPAPIARVDSPQQSPPPAAAFQPPSAPDVHSHLRLNKYCAPSPPKSPPKRHSGLVLELAPVRATWPPWGTDTKVTPAASALSPPMAEMELVHGHPATVSPTTERRQSWSGVSGDSWQVSPKLPTSNGDLGQGDATPRAPRTGSPETEPVPESIDQFIDKITASSDKPVPSSTDGSELKSLRTRASTGDLRSLMNANGTGTLAGIDVETPTSSNLSSPPTPTALLPGHMSPSASMSTGDSSPVSTNNVGSRDDAAGIEDAQHGGTLNAATYQEFLDKFCFFKSPPSVLAPLEDSFSPHHAPSVESQSIYGYFGEGAQRGRTPTPLSFESRPTEHPPPPGAGPRAGSVSSGGSASGATPRGSPPSRSPLGVSFGSARPWSPTGQGEADAPANFGPTVAAA